MPSLRFKTLFTQMCHGALAHGKWKNLTQTHDGPGLYGYLAELCDVAESTIISWNTKGRIPADPVAVSLLAEFGMDEAGMDYAWLEEFLREGSCFDTDMLARYVPNRKSRRPARAPHNLPAISGLFVERPEEVSRILDGFELKYPISIEGFGGMGKSTLAIWVAERCLKNVTKPLISPPFEHVVWVSAKDNPPDFDLSLEQVLNAIAERTGFTGLRDLSFAQKRGEVIELLRNRRVLVIVDNMETVTDDEVNEFLIRIPRQMSQVMVTTRHQKYRVFWQVLVRGLPEEGALQKIRHEIRAKNLQLLADSGNNELHHLYLITEGNPKAIELIIGYLKYTGITIAEALSELERATEDLAELFDYLFAHHWRVMDDPVRDVLLSLSFFAEAARRDSLQATTRLLRRGFKQAEIQLKEMSLLEQSGSGVDGEPRYTAHALTRAFAGRKLREAPEKESRFRESWVDWCVMFAEAYGASWQTYDLLEDEWVNLLECVEWCYRNEKWQQVIELEESLTNFFNIRAHWDARMRTGDLALYAARQLEDQIAYAWIIVRAVAPALEHLRRNEQRDRMCREALAIFEVYRDKRGIADALYHLGTINAKLEGYSVARPLLDRSLRAWEELDDQTGVGEVLNYLGLLCWREKRFQEGKTFLERAKVYRREEDQPAEHGSVLGNLGRIEMELGNLNEAETLLTRALQLFERVGHRYHTATVWLEIAKLKRRKGRLEEARGLLKDAKNTYLEIGAWARTTEVIAEMYNLEQKQNNLATVWPTIREMAALYERLEMPDEQRMMMRLLELSG